MVYAYGAAPDVLAKANANAKIWMPGGFNSNGGAALDRAVVILVITQVPGQLKMDHLFV